MDEERREELQNGDSCSVMRPGSFNPALPHSTLASFSDETQTVSNARAHAPQDKIQKKEIKFLAFSLEQRNIFTENHPSTISSHTSSRANAEKRLETFKQTNPPGAKG